MQIKLLAVVFLSFSLSACTMTPEECDPSIDDPSLLDKMGCVFSGSYEQRIENKKADIKALREEQQRLLAQSELLLDESVAVHGDYTKKAELLDGLENELLAMQSRLKEKQALNSSLKRKFAQAQDQIDSMRKTKDDASILQKQQEYEALKREVSDLNDALEGNI